MVAIRLSRRGTKKRPYYRIMVADSNSPRDGRFLENVGTYDPLAKRDGVRLKKDRIEHWLAKGAQPSLTVRQILRRSQ